MKTIQFTKFALIGLAGAAVMVLGSNAFAAGKPAEKPAEKAAAGGEAKLVITRSPTLGSGTTIAVLIDGQKVGTASSGNRYNGTIPAGKHTLSIRFEPLSNADKAANLEINVVAGQTYSFSATIKSGAITLQKNR